MKKDLFLVDADNTILDFHKSSMLSLKKAVEDFGKEWKEEYADIFTVFNDGLWKRLEQKEISRSVLISCRFPIFLNLIGLEDVSSVQFNEKFLHYLATLPCYIEGAREFLEKLREYGKVYIVTNGTTEIQKSRFAICGLDTLCDQVYVSEKIGADKPSKIYTEYVINHIDNFDKERAIWIGDSLSADIKAANDAKIESIWYNPKQQISRNGIVPTFQARNYKEILEILGF